MVADNKNRQLSEILLSEIQSAIDRTGAYGSIEIIIQNGQVTQISSRAIRKTKLNLGERIVHLNRSLKQETRQINSV
jgi:hypothetical protein